MSYYRRVLGIAAKYKKEIVLTILLNLLVVVFSLFSITVLIPTLKIIFKNTVDVTAPQAWTGLGNIKGYLESNLNYYITSQSRLIGKSGVLARILIFGTMMFLFKNLFRYLAAISMAYIQVGVERDLRNQIHTKILQLPVRYFNDQRKGDIIAKMTTDINEIQWALLGSFQRLVQDPLMIIFTLTTMIILSPQLTGFVVIFIPIMGLIINRIGNTLKKPSGQAKEAMGRILSHVDEHISGLPIIKSYVAENRVDKAFRETNESYFRYMTRMFRRRELSSPMSEFLGSMIIITIMWYGSRLILEKGQLEPEVFITYIALFYQVIAPAKNISNAIFDIKRAESSGQRIFSLLDAPNDMEDRPDALEKNSFDKELVLDNIGFAYDEKPVIKALSLKIKKGQQIALVGQSGSGKTTISSLINRFFDVKSGAILIDGIDYRQLKIKSLRNLIGYISQDAILFHDSIKNNLLLAKPEATEAEIIAAAKAANAHDFIMETEQGYDTNIGEGGSKLSGGQRQRLTIARAILKDPPILVLDEATSALDSESEKLVQEALEKIMEHRTSIVIAHRLSTVKHSDRIIVMQEGEIIEAGTHAELLAQNGAYRKLVDLQNL